MAARAWRRRLVNAALIGTTFLHNALLGNWYLRKRAAERERAREHAKPAYELRVEQQGIAAIAEAKQKAIVPARAKVAARVAVSQMQKTHGTSVLLHGKPSISAAFIDAELRRHGSPAAGTGAAFVELGRQYGIDPAVALAFFRAESHYGTIGIARKTKSIGNMRAVGWKGAHYKGFRAYGNFPEAIEDFYRMLKNSRNYVRGGRTTLEEIVPVYAPAAENPTAVHLRNIRNAVAGYRRSSLKVK